AAVGGVPASPSVLWARLPWARAARVGGLTPPRRGRGVPATFLPPMKWPISRMGASLGRSARVGEPLFPVSDSAACAAREAGGVTTINQGLGGDGTAILIQKGADLVHEALPCRLVRQDDVVAAFERNEPGIRDAAREHQPLLERAGGVAAAVQHERRRGDPRQQMGDIDFADGTGNIVLNGGAALTVGTADSTAFSGSMTGTGSLTKIGTGTIDIFGAESYTGGTTVNAGKLRLNGGALASTGALTIGANGTFEVYGINVGTLAATVGDFSGAGAVQLTQGSLKVGTANSTTFSGVISGGGPFIKAGTG